MRHKPNSTSASPRRSRCRCSVPTRDSKDTCSGAVAVTALSSPSGGTTRPRTLLRPRRNTATPWLTSMQLGSLPAGLRSNVSNCMATWHPDIPARVHLHPLVASGKSAAMTDQPCAVTPPLNRPDQSRSRMPCSPCFHPSCGCRSCGRGSPPGSARPADRATMTVPTTTLCLRRTPADRAAARPGQS
jgi:hypothetical protein